MKLSSCPNCNKSFTGFMNMTQPSSPDQTDFINKFTGNSKETYCNNCYPDLIRSINDDFKVKIENLQKDLQDAVEMVPIITGPAPNNWQYEIIGMITTQTTSGTGFMTELSRSFHDLFGGTSNRNNMKIVEATELCKADLRLQCTNAGGNAIISTDIDFNEIGSGSQNMLMVCMAGTAIKVTDLAVFSEKTRTSVNQIEGLNDDLSEIRNIYKQNRTFLWIANQQ